MQTKLSNSGKRLFLGHFIENTVIGRPFLRSDWPLHISLVPWFLCRNINRLNKNIGSLLIRLEKFDVIVGGESMFGSKKNIKVNLIQPSTSLLQLHKVLLGEVNKLGGLDTDEQFTGSGYVAHITHVRNRHKSLGDNIRIDSVHLTELTDDSHCTPLRHYRIGK